MTNWLLADAPDPLSIALAVVSAIFISATAAVLIRRLVYMMWDADLDQFIAETAEWIRRDPEFRDWLLAGALADALRHDEGRGAA